jgi:hypothetical protein
VISKVYRKILVLFILVQNFEILNLAMGKDEKVNIAFTYPVGNNDFCHNKIFQFQFHFTSFGLISDQNLLLLNGTAVP